MPTRTNTRKSKKTIFPSVPLTQIQNKMVANFYIAASEFPDETFDEIIKRMMGINGFPKTKNVKEFKRQCRKSFIRAALQRNSHIKSSSSLFSNYL